jgi:hypothetical protein
MQFVRRRPVGAMKAKVDAVDHRAMLDGTPTGGRIMQALKVSLAWGGMSAPEPAASGEPPGQKRHNQHGRAEALRNERKLSNQMASADWHLRACQEKLAATPTSANNYQQVLYEYLQAEVLYTSIVAGAMKGGRTAFGLPGDGLTVDAAASGNGSPWSGSARFSVARGLFKVRADKGR